MTDPAAPLSDTALPRDSARVWSRLSGFLAGALLVGSLLYVLHPMLADFSTYGFHDWDVETAYRYQAEGTERSWLQAVIDQMPEGVVLTDSTGATHLTNQSMQTFTNSHGYELFTPDGEPVALEDQPMIRALVDRMTTKQRELALRHPDGRLVLSDFGLATDSCENSTAVEDSATSDDVS